MLKKLEPMIQLNSQQITEATELHPVTTFEQGRREDGKTAKSKPPNPFRERTQRTLKKAAVPPAPKIPPLNTLNTLKKEAIPKGSESARHPSRFHFVPVCGTSEQTGTKWNLEVPCRTTRLRGSLPIRDLARGDSMECAGRALSGDGALAPGVANSVLIEAVACPRCRTKCLRTSSPKHTQHLRTFTWNKTWLPKPCDAVVRQHSGIQHISLAPGRSAGRRSALASFIARSSTRTSPRLGISPSTLRGPRMATAGNWPVQIERNVYDLQG